MALTTINNGAVSNITDVNQYINMLQQPSGGSETGRYFLSGACYTTGATLAKHHKSISQFSTALSVSIDTSVQAASGLNAPTTNFVDAKGFKVTATSTGTNTNAKVGGVYTLSY